VFSKSLAPAFCVAGSKLLFAGCFHALGAAAGWFSAASGLSLAAASVSALQCLGHMAPWFDVSEQPGLELPGLLI